MRGKSKDEKNQRKGRMKRMRETDQEEYRENEVKKKNEETERKGMMKRIQGKSKREKIKGKEEWRELEKGKDREDDKK